MLSVTVLLLWAVASIALVAGDCTVRESFINCLKPALKLETCVDKHDVKCACRYTYIEANCYDEYCSDEDNPVEKERSQCNLDLNGSDGSTSAVNNSTADKPEKSSSDTDNPNSAVPSAGLSMAAMAAIAIASAASLIWQL